MGDKSQQDLVTSRLDAFVDAAFAFAVTLLVIGGGSVPDSYAELRASAGAAPAFAIGFALIAMFWHAHVRWRAYGPREAALPVVLSLLLVFFVLLYVYPLRLMASSLVDYLGGTEGIATTADERASLFALYGLGFAAMAICVAALFATSLRGGITAAQRSGIVGELVIWGMLAAAGLGSALLSLVAPPLAPWVYSFLPIAIGLFVWRHDWESAAETRQDNPEMEVADAA